MSGKTAPVWVKFIVGVVALSALAAIVYTAQKNANRESVFPAQNAGNDTQTQMQQSGVETDDVADSPATPTEPVEVTIDPPPAKIPVSPFTEPVLMPSTKSGIIGVPTLEELEASGDSLQRLPATEAE